MIDLHAARRLGARIKDIAVILGCSPRTVSRKLQRNYTKKQRSVNPEIVKRRQIVCKLARTNTRAGHLVYRKFATARSIVAQLSVMGITASRKTVCRDLRKMKYRCLVRPRVPTRLPKDFAARKAFAQKYLRVRGFAKRVVFSDECWVSTIEATGRTMWCCKGEPPLPRESQSRFNSSAVMVWASCGWNWKGPLVILPAFVDDFDAPSGKKAFRLDRYGYVRRCLCKITANLKAQNRIFQQDGARAHANAHVAAYLHGKGIQFIEEWPAHSPDINPQEQVWALLKEKLGALVPRDLQDLITKVKQAWAAVTQEEINALVRNYRQKLQNLQRSNGESAKRVA